MIRQIRNNFCLLQQTCVFQRNSEYANRRVCDQFTQQFDEMPKCALVYRLCKHGTSPREQGIWVKNRLRKLKDSELAQVFGGALVVAILFVSVTAAVVQRNNEIDEWKAQIETTTLVLSEHVYSTTSSAYTVLDAIHERVVPYAHKSAQLGAPLSTKDTHEMLRDKIDALPQIDVASIVDRDGNIVNFTRSFPVPAINLSDRDYFIEHSKSKNAGDFISRPVKNKGNGKWVFYISRRLNDANGDFNGVVIVGISVDVFANFYATVGSRLGENASINLYRRDFTVMTRWPLRDDVVGTINKTGSTYDIIERQGKRAGVVLFTGPRYTDLSRSVSRIGSARALNRYPLVVGVTVGDDLYLSNWRKSVQFILGMAFGGTLLVVMGGIFLVREFRHREDGYETMRRLKRHAEAANEAKSNFLATMSHEIRTPLNGVLGITEILQTTKLDSEQRNYLDMVVDSGKQLLRVIDDILDFSKVEAGRMELEKVPFNPKSMMTDISAIYQVNAQRKGLALRCELDDGIDGAVLGDPSRIRQILANFISNAIKFTEKGEVCIRANRTSLDDGKHCTLRFSVSDTGIGIDEKARKTLFTPFMQADTSITRRFGGTGLGLAICKKLVDLMEGSVGVEDAPPHGTTFWFELRCEVVSDVFGARTQKSLAITGRQKAVDKAALTGCHVLLAEDNIINQHLATAVLTRLGCTYDVVENGKDAVKAVEEHNYTLVFMDGMMPVMDGYEATQRIRVREEAQQLPRLPVIALTASATTDDALRCMQAGMDDHLSKPYTIDGMRAMIEKWGKVRLQAS